MAAGRCGGAWHWRQLRGGGMGVAWVGWSPLCVDLESGLSNNNTVVLIILVVSRC